MTVFLAALRAEWTKARTVRSTWWSLVIAAAVSLGLAVMLGTQMAAGDVNMRADLVPVEISFFPLLLAQVALVAFGVLVVSAEYTTGTIRASLTATPRRGTFLAAKALVAAGIAAVASVVVTFSSFFAVQLPLGERGASFSDPGVTGAVLGACLYLTMMCAFAMGVATMLRSSALSLGILLPLLFLNSQGLASIPAIRSVTQYLPDQAGAGMMRVSDKGTFFLGRLDFGPGVAFAVLAAWVGIALAGGYLSLRRRDA